MSKRTPSSEFIAIRTNHGFEFVSKRGNYPKYRYATRHAASSHTLAKTSPSARSAP